MHDIETNEEPVTYVVPLKRKSIAIDKRSWNRLKKERDESRTREEYLTRTLKNLLDSLRETVRADFRDNAPGDNPSMTFKEIYVSKSLIARIWKPVSEELTERRFLSSTWERLDLAGARGFEPSFAWFMT